MRFCGGFQVILRMFLSLLQWLINVILNERLEMRFFVGRTVFLRVIFLGLLTTEIPPTSEEECIKGNYDSR